MICVKTCHKNKKIEYIKCETADLACEIALKKSKDSNIDKIQVCIFGFVEYEFKNGEEVAI